MTLTDANPVSGNVGQGMMTIAGVRLVSNSLRKSEFIPSFFPFWSDAEFADLTCFIHCHGADKTLSALPEMPDNPWSFDAQNARCLISRRNKSGETLWRVRGSLSFDRAEFFWHPRLFNQYYRSYEWCWMRGLGRVLLTFRLRANGGLVFHGTAANVGGMGILCVGPSGRGKSTLACLLDAAGFHVLSDERPVVRMHNGAETGQPAHFQVYGSPWHSSGGFASPDSVPLRKIYFIEHGPENQVLSLTPGQALSRLIDVAIVPWQNPVLFDPCLKTIEALLATIPTAKFAFRPDASAVEAIRRDLAAG